MARGGYFQGSDWVSYNSGTLTNSSSTSTNEIKKKKTIKCPNCTRTVPLKDHCVFCDYVFRSIDL